MRKRMYLIPAGGILFIMFFTVFGERGLLSIYHLNQDSCVTIRTFLYPSFR